MTYQFSVLMSVYFKEKPEYLQECLDSIILHQTLRPSEVVLVADGPLTEKLEQLLSEYSLKYSILQIYRLTKNVGLGDALNFGIQKCKYPIVARMDTDDICAPKRFEKQIKFLKENPEIKVLGTSIAEFRGNIENIISIKKLPRDNESLVKFSKFRNPLNHMTIMFYKNVVIDVGSYMPLYYLEDYFLWVRLIKNGVKLANIDEVLVFARVGDEMIGRRSNIKYIPGWIYLNKYMKNSGLISHIEFIRNIISISLFIFTPKFLKKIIYKHILRK